MDWYTKLFEGAGAKVGYVVGIIGTIATLATVNGSVTLPTKVLAIAGLFFVALVIISIVTIVNCKRILQESRQYPVHEFDPRKNGVYLYITYVSDIHPGALCTLYTKVNGIGKRMGYGIATNYDDYNNTEFKILYIEDDFQEKYEKAKNNDKTVLKDLYILPRIYDENVSDLYCILGGDINDAETEE